MPAAQANCPTCHGQGQPAGCPDCHGTTAAVTQHQQGQAVTKGRRKWPWVVGILAALGLLGVGGYFLFRNSPSTATTEAMNGKQPAPTSSASTNLDPTKPAQTAVAQKEPECPDGTLWDTKRKVCVQPATVPPFPSSIAITMPCPSNCAPAAPPPTTTASASAPAPKPPGTSPVVPVKANAVFDLTKVGDPAVFPSGT